MKAKLTETEIIDWWLDKYHNTNLDKVKRDHPEWEKDPEKHSRDFYQTYAVTTEQHNEWYDWFIKRVMKHYKIGKKRAIKDTAIDYLNVSPTVK